MEAAEPSELGILETRNGPEQPHLFGMLQLGLEADHVPERAERIVLAELDDRIRPAPGPRIVQADWLHRAEPERVDAALRHHLDRHAALEIGRVLLPVAKLGLLAVEEALMEGEILLLRHRA